MKKPLKIGLALVIGASVLGIFSDPEPSENRTYEEQQVEEQTPEKDWHEQVLKSLEKKEETEIPDYDQKTQYVDLMKSSLDQDLPVRSLTVKGEGERIQSAVVTIDQKNFEESAQIDPSSTPAGYKEIASENIEGGEFLLKTRSFLAKRIRHQTISSPLPQPIPFKTEYPTGNRRSNSTSMIRTIMFWYEQI